MANRFPGLRYDRGAGRWCGRLRPTDDSPWYRVTIDYHAPRPPAVQVLEPAIDPKAEHRYDDDSLCLYDHRVGEWHPGMFLTETIVPWTAEWLLYYEAWLIDPEHRWFGPEAPHGPLKRPGR